MKSITKKELIEQLKNVSDDTEIMFADKHYTYSIVKIDLSFSSRPSFPRVYLETETDEHE